MEFARRLQGALNDRGWTQTELVRRMVPHLKGSRVGRSNINKYVRAKTLPLPAALEAMAKALEMRPSDLLPARVTLAASEERPPMSVSMSPDGNMVRIKLNMELPFAKALEIQQIIRNHFKRNDEEGQ
jgi:transcriptional regulator with XRE-family HTH domain